MEQEVLLAAKEVLREEIAKTREELPAALTPQDLMKFMDIGKNKMYQIINDGKIPGAKKIMGEWRIPRDPFLAWWYGTGNVEKVINKRKSKKTRWPQLVREEPDQELGRFNS